MLEFLFNKDAGLQGCNFIKKKISIQKFSCEYCEIFKNIYFGKYLQKSASELFIYSCPYTENWVWENRSFNKDKQFLKKLPERLQNVRSSRPEVFLGKGILEICSKFTGEHPCPSVISVKLLRSLKTIFPSKSSTFFVKGCDKWSWCICMIP